MRNNGFIHHLISILVLPGTVCGIVPYFLNQYLKEPQITSDHYLLRNSGILFMAIGVLLVLICVFNFGNRGRGTLAPWWPTRKLVISGPYRYVRNPMILGVIFILFGEALYFNSISILIWALFFFVLNSLYFELVEEPKLERKFGDDYVDYKEEVNRWMPKFKAYKPKN